MDSRVARTKQRSSKGLSLLELLAVMTILGLIAALALANFRSTADTAKKRACYITKGEIEVQAQLWYRNQGTWPATDLSAIGANTAYFPEGLPVCPVDGTAYTIDAATHRVVGHTH